MNGPMMQNVILISLDTLRYDCVGVCPDKTHLAAYGLESGLNTPNLDAFFDQSAYFTQCVTPAAYTTAAHASVMTGLYPNHHGVRPFYKWALADGVGTLAEELKRHGYATVAVQEGGGETPLRTGSGILRGFDSFFGDEVEACAYCASQSRACLLFIHTFDIHSPYCWSHLEEVRANGAARKAAESEIARRLHVAPPADDSLPEQKKFIFRTSQNSRRLLGGQGAARLFLEWYVRGVNWFDQVRWPRIVGALRDAGLYEDGLVIVFADHGEALLPDFDLLPLTHMDSLLEDVIRVPLAFRAPGVEAAKVARQVSLVDVAPTVMAHLDLGVSTLGRRGRTDGRSLLRPADDSSSKTVCHFAETWRTTRPAGSAERKGNAWWQGQVDDPCEPYQVCVRCGDAKLLWHPGAPRLWRFMRPGARFLARVKSVRRTIRHVRTRFRPFLRRLVPGRVRALLRNLTEKLRESAPRRERRAAAPLHGGTQWGFGWKDARVFAVNLKEDPLEERPVRLSSSNISGPPAELLARIKEYWEDGVRGPLIDLSPADQKKVMKHLRDLGYVD